MAADPSAHPFGELLRRYRGMAGLSQRELASRAGLSYRGISDLERGVRRLPHPTTLRQLADALSLDSVSQSLLLATARAPLGDFTLPVALTSFIGREREISELRELLATVRLVSLVGTGGIGKTRLALEAAQSEVLGDSYLVELAPVGEPELVARSVAHVLNVVERGDQPLAESLIDRIGDRRLLLILDNCEHLISACADLVDGLLRACTHLRVLATTREALNVPGELVWRVPSLRLPEAMRLFSERASQRRDGLASSPSDAELTANICTRLDGIPLAIELAAARVPTLSLRQIEERLDDALGLLTRGARTTVDRQRTLRGTLDWSYDLLAESERLLLARLAVFTGGWTLEAAEDVCSGPGLTRFEVLNVLSDLVDKSMVVSEDHEGATWYRLLDPVRAYAHEKLDARGEELHVRSRHLDWYVDLAENFERDWRGPRQKLWFGRIEREESNLRAALRWCLDTHDLAHGLRLGGALGRFFWDLGSRAIEGRAWLSQLLQVDDPSVPRRVRAKALTSAGFLATYQGDTSVADALLNEALQLWRQLDDTAGMAETIVTLGVAAMYRGDLVRSTTLLEQGLAVALEVNDRRTAYWAKHQLATNAQRAGDHTRAQQLHEQSLELKYVQGDGYGIAMSLHGLAQIEWLRNNNNRALSLVRESLSIFNEIGHWRAMMLDLQLLALVTADCGDAISSTCLFGIVSNLQKSLGDRRTVAVSQNLDPGRTELSLAANRARLSPSAYSAAWRRGESMKVHEAVAYALAATAARSDPAMSRLTARETEILRLIAAGHSNQAIAQNLVLSVRTVERHIANAYSKLGLHNRVQAAAYADHTIG